MKKISVNYFPHNRSKEIENSEAIPPVAITHLVYMTEVDKNGNITYIEEKFDLSGNFLDHLMETINDDVTDTTKTSYTAVKKLLIKFFIKEGLLTYLPFGEDKKEYIPFYAVTSNILTKIPNWMKEEGYTPHTIRTYKSYIKAAFEKAQKMGILPGKLNPFRDGNHSLPIVHSEDVSVKSNMLNTLYEHKPSKTIFYGKWSEEMALDFWTMTLLTGVSTSVFLRLKKTKVVKNYFEFTKHKALKKTRIIITPALYALFNKWGYKHGESEYIFPFLELNKKDIDKIEEALENIDQDTIKEKMQKKLIRKITTRKINSFTNQINRYMKKISDELKFERKMTTNAAKSTFNLKENLEYNTNPLFNPQTIKIITNVEQKWLENNWPFVQSLNTFPNN